MISRVLDPSAQLGRSLEGLINKLGLNSVCTASMAQMLTFLDRGTPKLLRLSDAVSPQDTRNLKHHFPTTPLAMIYGAVPATDFATAAAALFEAVKQGVLTWKLKGARKLFKDFVNKHLLVVRPGREICGHIIGPEIGKGGFGRVYRCTNLASPKRRRQGHRRNEALRQELEALRKVSKLSKESEFLMPVSHPSFMASICASSCLWPT